MLIRKRALDLGTELAIRRGDLWIVYSEAISADQVRGVIGALKESAGTAMDRHEPEGAKELVKLCKGVRAIPPSRPALCISSTTDLAAIM